MFCKNCNNEFEITDEDRSLFTRLEVPDPTHCPACRQIRRLVWRNEKNLYQRKCNLTGKDILAVYPPDSKYKVYEVETWYGDGWDAMDCALDYDNSKSFFEQFSSLQKEVPRPARVVINNTNSEYANQVWNSKDAYMCFDAGFSENIMYCAAVYHSKDVVDSFSTRNSEMSYNLVDCQNCFNSRYSQDCSDGHDIYFSFDCKGCSNIVFCSNLRNQTYKLFNKSVSQEEFDNFVKEIRRGSHAKYSEYIERWRQGVVSKAIHKYSHNIKTVNCSGDYILNSKNCLECFNMDESEDSKYCNRMDEKVYSSMDLDYCAVCELVYESTIVTGNSLRFCLNSHSASTDCWYCDLCLSCKNCFGCIGLKHKQYCILNKQYDKETYFKIKDSITAKMKEDGEWGEFFPVELSPFAYNETIVMEYYPLTKAEAATKGYRWKDDMPGTVGKETIKPESIPDEISQVTDDITKEILVCSTCQRNYKIIEQELAIYREGGLPIPRQCFKCRNIERLSYRNPQKLYQRFCSNCQKEMQTTYAPERKELVYCEECYQKEIY